MRGKFEAPRNHTGTVIVVCLLLVTLLAAAGFLFHYYKNREPVPESTLPPVTTGAVETDPPQTTEAPTEEPTEETTEAAPQVIATATVSVQGDLLMHEPVIRSGYQADGTYDYQDIFQYLTEYLDSYDYSVMNFETTLGGPSHPYQGNPLFNCRDEIGTSCLAAGYDMLLTANNHCSDTATPGILRTLETLRSQGITTLGTQLNDEEQKYEIVEVNGIKLGMVCYTYATGVNAAGKPAFNYNAHVTETGIVNFFLESDLESFYEEAETHLTKMQDAGAEATIIYLHWDKEYKIVESETQNTIAQALCDMGYDVIVGGHPHVVQPMELLTSQLDPSHKTVCIYSLGNAVSNQRTGGSTQFPDGYVEDGVLLTLTFEKYDDGHVYLSYTDVIPTWVKMYTENGVKKYNILPLDMAKQDSWQEAFGLSDADVVTVKASYQRTMDIVGEGLQQCQDYLTGQTP